MNGTFSSLFLTFWHLRFQNDALTLGSGDFIDRLIELKKRHEAGKIHNYLCNRVTKTPSARQQCLLESFCKSGKFKHYFHYWLKNFWIIWKMSGCYQKYPDKMQSVRMMWKLSRQSKKCPDNLENVSGSSGKCPDDLESFLTI